jgi:hypothetical protein
LFEKAVIDYDNNFRKKNKLPKNHDWKPVRWCSKDIVFALIVDRHNSFLNCLEVDCCLMANPPQYYENSGPRVAMGYILSEAYKCGSSMEIVFTKNVETRIEDGVEKGRVPAYIYDLACELGVKLKHVFEGHITPFEARQMYMELAGFSEIVKERVMKLSVDGLLSPERACFLVMGGLWSVDEAESIILGCKNPESILLSLAEPSDRHLYLKDVITARGAVLGGALDRKLRKKELMKDGEIVESEDEELSLEIFFDGDFYAKNYKFEEECLVPWIEKGDLILKSDELMSVLVRARTSSEIRGVFQQDLQSLEKAVEKYKMADLDVKVFLLYPRDFEEITENEKMEMKKKVGELGALIMVSPESVAMLDKEATHRIEIGRMVRHE